ncbi:MAG TPA: hypothetical protein VLL98_02240 [Rickettsiales bacterium]|nr:hypothetical protein [Rickettsiales bacterium]
MFKDLILELLSQDGYYTLNKKLVKLIGLENSFLLSFFIDKYKFFKEEFFYTKENILNDTRLTEYSLNSSLKFLKDNNLIFIVKKGCPARNYYDINFKRIEDLLKEEIELKKEEKIQENPTTSTTENNTTSDCENLITSPIEITTASDPENTTTSDTENTMTYNKNKISKNKEVRTNKEKILKEDFENQKTENSVIPKPSKKELQQSDPLYPQFTEIANRIKQLIETQKRINITNSQLSNWTTEISKLYKTLESARGSENAIYSMFLIINTLNADIDYEDKYKPVIESGKSFREKFIKIEDYYKRRQMQYMKQKRDEDCDDLII